MVDEATADADAAAADEVAEDATIVLYTIPNTVGLMVPAPMPELSATIQHLATNPKQRSQTNSAAVLATAYDRSGRLRLTIDIINVTHHYVNALIVL